jgi:molybdopterin synthase catalytic subunit
VGAFQFTREPIDAARLRATLAHPGCGGFAVFEGWVRDENDGERVRHLEYEAFEALAVRDLAIGEVAVWVGVSAVHRDEAFRACRFIIDEVKHRVPIWKKEHYANGDSGWVNCERCAAPGAHVHAPAHETDA